MLSVEANKLKPDRQTRFGESTRNRNGRHVGKIGRTIVSQQKRARWELFPSDGGFLFAD